MVAAALVAVGLAAIGCGSSTAGAGDGGPPDPVSGLGWVDVAALPAQARETLDLVDRGGPFPYAKDGSVFANREGILPDHPRGWYREYTVPTPGADDRGARRIVAGSADDEYYTDDHYRTFRRIRR